MKQILIVLSLTLFAATVFAAEEKGRISGRWITNDVPMSGAKVLLFSAKAGPAPSSDRYLRVPDVTTKIESDGHFSVQVPAGSYYLVMRKTVDDRNVGPPSEGDLQYYSRDKKGNARQFVVKAGGETDIGTIKEAVAFKKKQLSPVAGMTAIEGTVTNDDGTPLEGVSVFAYTSPEMKGKPLYASEPTGKDGRYMINVYNQGTYYLKARTHYGGGLPQEGETLGGYGEPRKPAVVPLRKGEIRKGVDIRAVGFAGRGKKM